MVQRLIDQKVRSTIMVSPQEVSNELSEHPESVKAGDRVSASHILIRVREGRSEGAAQAKIEQLYQQLKQGSDFAQLAKDNSEDSHAQDGGLMSWVSQGELMPELDTALFSLAKGEISQPIKTRLGFHIIKVEDRKSAANLSLEQANNAVFQKIYERKFQQAFSRWLAELKEKAYIEIIQD